jgi:hypothetical protein
LALWCVAACGGDDSNNGFVTGLPAEQKLSTLSDDDVKKACRSVNDGATAVFTPTALKRAACVSVGLEAALTYSNDRVSVDVSKCQQAADACVNSNEQDDEVDIEVDLNDCDEASANDLKGCEATVGEYETCINMVLSEAQRMLSELTCQNAEKLASEEYDNDGVDPAKIPQCQSLMTKCPDAELGVP